MRALSNTTDMKSATVRAPQRPAVVARSARVSRQQTNRAQMGAFSSCSTVARPQQMLRSGPIVSVAAQEAPAAQATSTKVRSKQSKTPLAVAAAVAAPGDSVPQPDLQQCRVVAACSTHAFRTCLYICVAERLPRPTHQHPCLHCWLLCCCPCCLLRAAVDRSGCQCRVLLQ